MRKRPSLVVALTRSLRAFNKTPVDRVSLAAILLLVLLGAVTFLSASLSLVAFGESQRLSRLLLTQLGIGVGGGLIALAVCAFFPLRWVKRAAPVVYGGALALGALTFVPGIGVEINGARRWIDIGFTTLQTSELVKFALLLVTAWILAKTQRAPWHLRLAWLGGTSGLAIVLFLLQRDTSNLVVSLVAVGAMVFVAGLPWKYTLWIGAGATAGFAALVAMRPYIWERLAVFLGLIDDPAGASFQVQTAKIAVGSGGLWGRGIGEGLAKYSALPQALNDSIFALYAEETGFVGALILISLFVVLGARLGWIGVRMWRKEPFGGLLLIGFATLLNMQAAWNIGAMVGALPLSGMTLPFVSQGATSLVGLLAMSGIALHISRFRV